MNDVQMIYAAGLVGVALLAVYNLWAARSR